MSTSPHQRRTVTFRTYVQLSVVDPPDARQPGPVVGPGSRVWFCDAARDATRDSVCLEVEEPDGVLRRGYTYRDFFAVSDARSRRRRIAAALAILAGMAAALATAFAVS